MPILIAEDDPDDRYLLEVGLDYWKDLLDLHFVQDGEELMYYLQHKGLYQRRILPKPELIFLDLRMPRFDGREVLVEIKRDSNLKNIPIVIWTASELEADWRSCMEAGASGFITKPARLQDLSATLRNIVSFNLLLTCSLKKRDEMH